MEFIQLKCPSCQASLEIEDTLDTCFCKYCGNRIVIADLGKDLIDAKTKLKLADKQLELEKERHRQELEKKKLEFKQASPIFCILAAMAFFSIFMLFMLNKP